MAELIGTEKVVSGGNTDWQNTSEYAQKVKNIKGFLGFWRDALDNEFFPGMTAVYNNTDLYPLVGEIHFRCNNIEVKDGSDYDVKEGLTEVAIEFWVQDNNGDKVASDYLSIDLIPKIKDTERTNYKYDSNTRIHTYTFTTVEKSDKYSIDVTIKVEKWTQWGVDVPILDNTHYTINIPANYKEYILTLTCTPTERKDKVKYSLTDGNSGTLDENPKEVTTREETGKVTFSVTDSDNYECKPTQVNWSEDTEINTICYEKNELVVKANFNRYDYDTKMAYVGFTAEIQKELKEDLSIEANMYFLNTQNPAVLIGNINKGEKTGTVNNSRLIVNSDVVGNIEKLTVGVSYVKFGGNNFNNEYSNEVFNYVKINLNTMVPSDWESEEGDEKRHNVIFYAIKNNNFDTKVEVGKFIVEDGYKFNSLPPYFDDKISESGFNLGNSIDPTTFTYEQFKNYPITSDIEFHYFYFEDEKPKEYQFNVNFEPSNLGPDVGYSLDNVDGNYTRLGSNSPRTITTNNERGTIYYKSYKENYNCEPEQDTYESGKTLNVSIVEPVKKFTIKCNTPLLVSKISYSLDNSKYTKLDSVETTVNVETDNGTVWFKTEQGYVVTPSSQSWSNGSTVEVGCTIETVVEEFKFNVSCTPSELFSHISYALDNKSGTYVKLGSSNQEIRTGSKTNGTIYFKTDNDEIYKCEPDSASYRNGGTVNITCTEYIQTKLAISVEIGEVGDNKLDVRYIIKTENENIDASENIGIKLDFTVNENKEIKDGTETQSNDYSIEDILRVSKTSPQTISKQIDRKMTNSKYKLVTKKLYVNNKEHDISGNQEIKIYI